GFVYSTRYHNPTIHAFETAVANLEGGEAAYAFSSGMAAIHMAFLAADVRAGSHVVAAADVYGATFSLLNQLFTELGVTVHWVDILNLDAVRTALTTHTPAVLFAETISNPLLKIANLPELAALAHASGALFLVDNTFCSPYLCNPLQHGADMVIHSATKYLSGHGDVMAGVVVTNTDLREKMYTLNKLVGSSMGPFEAWLALRGLRTLALRMRQQCENALTLATWLKNHPKITHVHYPYLPDHPQHALAQTLTGGRGGGGVLSFTLSGAGRTPAGREEVFTFMDALRLIQPATTLGDLYSLVLYPAIASHRGLTPEQRAAVGIGDDLVRLSVGIEDAVDLCADLERALAVV
ncbi:MAG TPA: PLP-dependent aspartate aminotransferase family protein, partial [Anaerolineales bacterium]|nr:PLP-dependent aspartate aminotransferase family protein [Anaerolineales bacterium]